MNFIVNSTVLLRHLQSISGVLSTSNSLPILDNFLFNIADGELKAVASDMETTMTTIMNVEATENCLACIPAKKLLEILKNIADQPLSFKVDESFKIEMTHNNGKASMQGFNGAEFPKTPEIKSQASITISGDIVGKAINKTLFATGNDDLRPVMSGVYCQFSPSDITFVATDAHKLVRYRRTDGQSTGGSAFILPKKALNLLKGNLSGNEEVKIEYNDSNAIFTFGDIVMMCRLVDGKYPNYEAVIPKENPNVLIVDRLQFLASIKRVSIFANKTTHQVRLTLAGSELKISAEDIDFADKSDENMVCVYDGVDMEIGFNSRFLMEMLNNIDSKEVKIQMSEPNRAGLLIPVLEDENSPEDILMLVMPVMINR